MVNKEITEGRFPGAGTGKYEGRGGAVSEDIRGPERQRRKGVMRGVGPGQTRADEHIHSAPVIGLRIANHRSKS